MDDPGLERALGEARKEHDAERFVEAVGLVYGELAPAVRTWLIDTLDVEGLPGPFRIGGAASAVRRRTVGEVFGWFGDAPLPWIEIGGANGVPFWLVVASGAVVTLHHDATLYETAAGCTGADPESFLRELEATGSELDLATLLSLQAAGAAAGVTTASDDPKWFRTVRDQLGAAGLVRRVDTVRLEFLGVSARELDEWLLSERPTRGSGGRRRASRTPVPWPLADALAAGPEVRDLDLSGIAGKRLSDVVLDLHWLERLDLSHNRGLDLDDAFRRLAALPNLQEVVLDDCKLEAIPDTFGDLQAIRVLRIRGSVLGGAANFVDLAAALPILARLPALETLEVSVATARGPTDGLGVLRGLRRVALHSVFTEDPEGLLAPLSGLERLESVAVGRIGRYRPTAPPDLAGLPNLTSVEIDGTEEQWASIAGCRALVSITAVEHRMPAPPPAAGRDGLRELALNVSGLGSLPEALFVPSLTTLRLVNLEAPVPDTIRRCRELKKLVLETPRAGASLPDAVRELPSLEVLDAPIQDGSSPFDAGTLPAIVHLQLGQSGPWRLRTTPPGLRWFAGADDDSAAALRSSLLESIDLSGRPRLPAGFVGHPGLRRLRWWFYGWEGSTDEAWAAITSLPALEDLNLAWLLPGPGTAELRQRQIHSLAYTNVTTRNVRPPDADLDLLVAALDPAHLTTLSLEVDAPTPLPDALDGFHALRTLQLRGLATPIDPARWARLTSLRVLELRRTRARAADRAATMKALPGCRVAIVD